MSDETDFATRAAQAILDQSGVFNATKVIADFHVELAKEGSDFEAILKQVTDDRLLARRIIDISNSAWFGGRVKSDTVAIAFGRLGVADFYKVVVSAALRFHVGAGDRPELKRWWMQAETTARLGELFAQQLDPALVEPAFFTGLLHDCAVPLLMEWVPDYSYLVEGALEFGPEAIEMERECNQFTHCDAGAALVRAWKFPAAFAAVIRQHHSQTLETLMEDQERRLLAILLLAKRVGHWCSQDVPAGFHDPGEAGLEREIADIFRLTRVQLGDVLGEMTRLYRLRQGLGPG